MFAQHTPGVLLGKYSGGRGCTVRTQRALFWAIKQLSLPNRPSRKGTGQHFLMGSGWLLLFPDGSYMDECGT